MNDVQLAAEGLLEGHQQLAGEDLLAAGAGLSIGAASTAEAAVFPGVDVVPGVIAGVVGCPTNPQRCTSLPVADMVNHGIAFRVRCFQVDNAYASESLSAYARDKLVSTLYS